MGCASKARPTQAGACGNGLAHDPETSCCLGPCMPRSPRLLVMKYRDLKINLESSKYFADDLNVIDLSLMIHVGPFLARNCRGLDR
jgi:hypothetical protein